MQPSTREELHFKLAYQDMLREKYRTETLDMIATWSPFDNCPEAVVYEISTCPALGYAFPITKKRFQKKIAPWDVDSRVKWYCTSVYYAFGPNGPHILAYGQDTSATINWDPDNMQLVSNHVNE